MSAITGLPAVRWAVPLLIALAFLAWAAPQPAEAALSGAIFTTDAACSGVDLNHYVDKGDVYLDGGPHGNSQTGLPDGQYYVKITEPNGTLLGTSVGTADETPVLVQNGEFATCYQLEAILEKASDGSPGYDTTTNNGNEYKVWLCEGADFKNSECKTDNFKVFEQLPTPELGACEPGGDRILLVFEIRLSNQNQSSSIINLSQDIPAGTYEVTLASFDEHSLKPGQNQQFEQWYLRFFYEGSGTLDTDPISDLPESQNTLEESVGTYVLTDDVNAVKLFHERMGDGFPTAESVMAVCAALDPVTSG